MANNIHEWLFNKQLEEDTGSAPIPIHMEKAALTNPQPGQTPMINNPWQPMQNDPNRFRETHYATGVPGAFDPTLQQKSMVELGMLNRDKAGPMSFLKGFPGSIGAGLSAGMSGIGSAMRGFGSGIKGYTKELFNDPERMALLQGGLSMMDPNTYYDQQGFGSPWTGLRVGLGSAQQGMKGVYDRRKQLADIEKTKADAFQSRQGLQGGAEFERLMRAYLDPTTPQAQKDMIGKRLGVLQGGDNDNYASRYMQKYVWEDVVPDTVDLENALTLFANTMDATYSSEAGIDFGPGADFKSKAYAVLSETFGQDLGESGERAANTRAFMSSMSGQVAKAITAFGAGTGLSDADREFAKSMVGQDPSQFNEESLGKLLVLNEGAMRGQLMRHNKRMMDLFNGNPPAGVLREIPAMSKNLKQHMVRQMKAGKFKINGKLVKEKPDGWVDEYPGQWDSLVGRNKAGSVKPRVRRIR